MLPPAQPAVVADSMLIGQPCFYIARGICRTRLLRHGWVSKLDANNGLLASYLPNCIIPSLIMHLLLFRGHGGICPADTILSRSLPGAPRYGGGDVGNLWHQGP